MKNGNIKQTIKQFVDFCETSTNSVFDIFDNTEILIDEFLKQQSDDEN